MEREVVFPRRLRDLRRATGYGGLLLAGLVILIVVGWVRMASAVMEDGLGPSADLVIIFAVELFVAAGILALLVPPRAPSPKRFLVAGVLATGVLFTADPVALLGGAFALLGSLWGYLARED